MVEGEMLALWWLDSNNNPIKKVGMKTLKRGDRYLNVTSISASYPTAEVPEITFATSEIGDVRQRIPEFLDQAFNTSQEWKV
jgi:hypothetical protein